MLFCMCIFPPQHSTAKPLAYTHTLRCIHCSMLTWISDPLLLTQPFHAQHLHHTSPSSVLAQTKSYWFYLCYKHHSGVSKIELPAAEGLKNSNILETSFLYMVKRDDFYTYINMKSNTKLINMTIIVHNFLAKNVL